MMNELKSHFPFITEEQIRRFSMLEELYKEWNAQINVISRKDIELFHERHLFHSLAIAKVLQFKPGARILDVGTGGGFPGIPLAILFPETDFILVDSIGKKIKVVQAVADSLELKNVKAIHGRAENVEPGFDFVVSRAVTQMPRFVQWVKGMFKSTSNHDLPNGILYLKGGDLSEELKDYQKVQLFPIKEWFSSEFFDTKFVVYLPRKR